MDGLKNDKANLTSDITGEETQSLRGEMISFVSHCKLEARQAPVLEYFTFKP